MGPEKYGQYYWCVKVTKGISESGEIYVHADNISTSDNGAIVFGGNTGPNLIIPSGKWLAVYAASVLDGSAVAVEHWKGEVVRGG